MAYILPERFVTELMGTEGYMIDIRGSIGYVHKCEKVEISLRQTKSCYQEIPVSYLNKTYFLHPDSKILRPHGEEISFVRLLFNIVLLLSCKCRCVFEALRQKPSVGY